MPTKLDPMNENAVIFCSQKEYLSNESLIQLVSPPMRLSDLWEFHYTTLGYGHLDPYTNTLSI